MLNGANPFKKYTLGMYQNRLFVTEVTHISVSTGSGQRQALSRQGSLVNPLWMCQLHKMEKVAGINSQEPFVFVSVPW